MARVSCSFPVGVHEVHGRPRAQALVTTVRVRPSLDALDDALPLCSAGHRITVPNPRSAPPVTFTPSGTGHRSDRSNSSSTRGVGAIPMSARESSSNSHRSNNSTHHPHARAGVDLPPEWRRASSNRPTRLGTLAAIAPCGYPVTVAALCTTGPRHCHEAAPTPGLRQGPQTHLLVPGDGRGPGAHLRSGACRAAGLLHLAQGLRQLGERRARCRGRGRWERRCAAPRRPGLADMVERGRSSGRGERGADAQAAPRGLAGADGGVPVGGRPGHGRAGAEPVRDGAGRLRASGGGDCGGAAGGGLHRGGGVDRARCGGRTGRRGAGASVLAA